MTYIAAVFAWLARMFEPYLPEAAAFLTAWRLKGLDDAEKRATERADALEARIITANEVAAMSDADVRRMLTDEWASPERRKRVRGLVPDLDGK